MCLEVVKKVYDKPKEKEIKAYKVFQPDNFAASGITYTVYDGPAVKLNQWIQADASTWHRTSYPAGFHCYASKVAALRSWLTEYPYVIMEVRIRGIVAEGLEDGRKVLVANEMFIPLPYLKMSLERKHK